MEIPLNPKRQPPAQTAAAGKRQSAGYKASKTVEDAMTAMAPKGRTKSQPRPQAAEPTSTPFAGDAEKQSAFEKWMAEERAIQARQQKQHGSRALEGDVIMDATARLLAPKGTTQQPPAAPRAVPPVGQERPQKAGRSEPARQKASTPTRQKASVGAGHPAGPAGQKPSGQTRQKPSAPAQQKPPVGCGTPDAPQAKSPAPKQELKKERSRDRRRGPAEPALRLGSQKDSTEQQSLMKPYYFNPNED